MVVVAESNGQPRMSDKEPFEKKMLEAKICHNVQEACVA
jgi:hypothetical protein